MPGVSGALMASLLPCVFFMLAWRQHVFWTSCRPIRFRRISSTSRSFTPMATVGETVVHIENCNLTSQWKKNDYYIPHFWQLTMCCV
jgi:hypothetical protein